MNEEYIFTSESVTEGHPDKLCDQVSDAILSAYLKQDKNARVACECFAGHNFILISGEITSTAEVDCKQVAYDTIKNIGYTDHNSEFNCDDIEYMIRINKQSPDIAMGVDIGGAGDQGIMFGYASDETPELMPAPIQYSHMLAKRLAKFRKETGTTLLKPDGKSQVSVSYDKNNNIVGIDTILVSAQHSDKISQEDLENLVREEIIYPTFDSIGVDMKNALILVNPTGRFVIGGPEGDTGLTGRKIIVDTYGGMGRHGGGCFSGKDPTKVDRSAAYMARFIAKNIVAKGMARKCEIQLAYAIGVDQPVSININTFNTSKLDTIELMKYIEDNFDLTPQGIIKDLGLKNIDYTPYAAYGHMGREDLNAPWERIIF